jgi:chromosome transmission fidelity protein 1
MARCVAVVGLPYPDITDPVLKEKMSLLDSTSAISGRDYYQNLCMRAVNQSVGRAIRHANDFAAIVLLDQRYNTNVEIKEGLPQWLTNGSPPKSRGNFRQHVSDMARFFDNKQLAPDDTV